MSISAPESPPPLRDGDRLTSGEFMRRWEAMPDLEHAEFFDGIVYLPSPVSLKHSVPHSLLATWLGVYAATPGCQTNIEGTWLMGERDVPQPDLALWILPESGGQSRVAGGEYSAGAPELIVEVAASSQARDLGVKLRMYQRLGVREYLVAVVSQANLIWHEWNAGGFQMIQPDADGILRSHCFPGLWLDPLAFWSGDRVRVLIVLHQGLATPEHAAFAARLAGPQSESR